MKIYPGLRARNTLLDLVTYLLLSLGAIIMVLPFLWMVATSFKLPADQYTKTLIPNPATLDNFKELWQHLPFPRLLFNSLWLSILSTIWALLPSLWSGSAAETCSLPCC
ncbi:MAG: hypothetical protein NUW24_16800 [Anaerolineae bacterium]|nr:hypothetical protein [Anaerolineae bacterium]